MTLLIFILRSYGEISAQHAQWAKSIQSEGFDEGYDLVTDADGNTYVGGQIEFDADFGSGIILSSAGIHDIFLAKYSPTGRLVWARVVGGKGGDKVQSITLDGNGHVYVVGEFEDTCYWGGIMKTTWGPGVNNLFVAQYDTSGSVNWVRNIGTDGPVHTRGYGVSCDENGNVYACGGTKGNTFYEGTYLFTTAGDYDGIVVKFDPNGNFQWARRMGGTDSDKAYGIVSDRNGYIYVTGYFVGLAEFSPGTNLNANGHTDIFLAKFDTAGTLQWVTQAGDTGFDRGWDITHNVNGQIIITGEFQTGHFGSNMAYSRGNEDMFVAAYDNSGNNLWVVAGGSEEDDIGRGVSHDNSGNIYVIGDYASHGIFPPDTLHAKGFADVFMASYTADGQSLNWVRSYGGLQNDRGRGIGTDQAGNVYACGEYVDSINFDNIKVTGDTLLDIFVTKIVPGSICSVQASITADNSCYGTCDGSATALANGSGPFSYTWSVNPSLNSPNVSGLCPGNYSVTVTDQGGCSATTSFTLNSPQQLIITPTTGNPVCNGACDGSALASASGNGPFSYHWNSSPVQNDSLATSLCAGVYEVTVTDAAGCTSVQTVTLVDPPALQVSLSANAASCAGSCDATATALASGQGPFSYSWDTSPVQTDSLATGLCQGSYTVSVSDNAGCTFNSSITINDPMPLLVTGIVSNTGCISCSNGSIDLQVSGGSMSYTYLWSNSATTEDLQNIPAGTYTVCVTDFNQCQACDTFTVSDPSTGIRQVSGKSKIQLFPNPSNDITNVILSSDKDEVLEYSLFAASGRELRKGELKTGNNVIQITGLPSGVYFIKILTKESEQIAVLSLLKAE